MLPGVLTSFAFLTRAWGVVTGVIDTLITSTDIKQHCRKALCQRKAPYALKTPSTSTTFDIQPSRISCIVLLLHLGQ